MDKLEEMYQSFTNSITEDAENIISTDKSNAELQYSQTYNVHVPKHCRIIIHQIFFEFLLNAPVLNP